MFLGIEREAASDTTRARRLRPVECTDRYALAEGCRPEIEAACGLAGGGIGGRVGFDSFDALSDRSQASDDQLPPTGVPLELERELSAAFIRTPDQAYGTRCSTIVITERARRRLVTHVFERTFTVGSALL